MKFFPMTVLSSLFLLSLQGHAQRRLFTPVCDRTPQVRDAIVAQFGVPCDKVKAKEIAEIRALDISRKDITGLQLGDFDGFDNLRFLSLYHNELEEIPEGLFLSTPNLRELYLSNNFLKSLTNESLDGLQNSLRKLTVARNGLTTLILQEFRHLETLDADDNKLGLGSGLDFFLRDLPELKELSLSSNELNSIDISILHKQLPKLESLSLAYNHLQMIINFSEWFPLLEELELNNNQIRNIPEGLLFSGVETLHLDGNRIFSLPEKIPRGKNIRLQYMNLLGNPIIRLPRWAKEMDEAMKLTINYDSALTRCRLAVRQLFGR